MKPKILLAEDHPSMREMLAKIILREFDLVASVESGSAAVDAAIALTPDAMVVDVRMPVIDGIEVARRLKEQGCKSKIIFVSVSESASQVAACFAVGGDAYVSKLRMASDLICALKEALAGEKFISPMAGISMPFSPVETSRVVSSNSDAKLNGNGLTITDTKPGCEGPGSLARSD